MGAAKPLPNDPDTSMYMSNQELAQFSAGRSTPIAPSFFSRLGQAARYVITGATEAWFGPLQPLAPIPPQIESAQVKGRRRDYQAGENLNQRPRGYEPVTFDDLRGLSRTCDVMRLVIQTRLDQMSALDWQIRVRRDPEDANKKSTMSQDQRNRVKAITEFMQQPDQEHDYRQWTRMFLEDHFVIDAVAVYKRPTRAGKLYSLDLIDGGSITPKLDGYGRRPFPPDVAYQQILKGVPAVDYTSDELYYVVENPTTNHLYGYSRVEQVLLTANIAVRRALFQLEYYTKGSQPDAFLALPETWDVDTIKDFQTWLDSLKQQRRALRVIPGAGAGQRYIPTKEPVLKDEYDDYLNRLICFAFSVAPTALVKMMNRAQSETQHDQALEEGLGPTMRFYTGFWNRVLRTEFNSPDLEYAYVEETAVDPQVQATIDAALAGAGIYTIDEIRSRRGDDAFGGAAALPMVKTATGYVTVGANVPEEDGGDLEEPDPATQAPMLDASGKPVPHDSTGKPLSPPAKPNDKNPQANQQGKNPEGPGKPAKTQNGPRAAEQVKKLAKRDKFKGRKVLAVRGAPARVRRAAVAKLTRKIAPLLKELGKHVAHQASVKLFKGELTRKLRKSEEDYRDFIDGLDLSSLAIVAATTSPEVQEIAQAAGMSALAVLGVDDNSELVGQVSQDAVDYAKQRAAYLVGKRILDDGSIVDNPNAEYQIDDTTRDMLRSLITDSLGSSDTAQALIDKIEEGFPFSDDRARMIAYTEIGNANATGTLNGFMAARDAGVENEKAWMTSGGDGCCDDCTANEDQGPIPLDEDFQSGDDAPLAHPNCQCVLVSVVAGEED